MKRVFSFLLALSMVFSMLPQPARAQEYSCPQEVHDHTQECYALVCGSALTEGHTAHAESCYGDLICNIPVHSHGETCTSAPVVHTIDDCICADLDQCQTDAPIADCLFCQEHPAECLGKEKAVCICEDSEKCAEGKVKADCTVCAGDLSKCEGKAPVTQPPAVSEPTKPSCSCQVPCGTEMRNYQCPICGADNASLEDCALYESVPTAYEKAVALLAALPRAEEVTPDITAEQHAAWTKQTQAALESTRALTMEEIASLENSEDFMNAQLLWQALENVTPVAAAHNCGNGSFATALPTGGELSSGSYYLDSDITATEYIRINSGATVTLCLNGHTLTMNNVINNSYKFFYIRNRGTLKICDCGSGGTIVGTANQIIYNEGTLTVTSGAITNGIDASGGECGILNTGTVTVSGGEVTGSAGISNKESGQVTVTGNGKVIGYALYGIYNYSADGTVIISGGTVEYGIRNHGTLTVSGGTIISTIWVNASGIHNYGGTVNISNGTVKGRLYGIDNTGTLYLSGSPTITGDDTSYADIQYGGGNIYAQSNHATPTAYIGSKLTVKVPEPAAKVDSVIIHNATTDKFTLANTDGYYLIPGTNTNAGHLVLTDQEPVPAHTHTDGTVFDKEFIITSGELASGHYFLGDTVPTISGDITIAAGETVTLCLNGKTLNLGYYHNITNAGTLTICDCGTSGTIKSNNYSKAIIDNDGTFTITGGTITTTGCTHILYNNGTAYIQGGRLSSSNTAGNVIFNDLMRTLSATGGTISYTGSEAFAYCVKNSGTMMVDGATIENNGTCADDQAQLRGIYSSGTLTVKSGTISAAGKMSYGVTNDHSGIVHISGGTVSAPSGYAIYSFGTHTATYLSGNPTITGDDNSYADIYYFGGSIYAQSSDATPAAYSGSALTVWALDYAEDKVVIHNVTDANKGSFSTTAYGWYLVEKEGNLVLTQQAPHTHTWSDTWTSDATHHWKMCTDQNCPNKDDYSNVTGSEHAEHSWVDATCTAPKTCSVCQATEGNALGHSWVDATCTAPKTCSVCQATEGDALEHTFTNNTCSCGLHSHDGGQTTFEALTATSGELSSGTYYLSGNVTAIGNIEIPANNTVTLCLNGKTLKMGNSKIVNNGTLTVCDCQETASWGAITSGDSRTIENKGNTTIQSGKIINTTGGSNFALYNNNNLTVTGGRIAGNYGICSTGGTVTISGSPTISGTQNYGIYVTSKANVHISGDPTITSEQDFGILVIGSELKVTGGTITGASKNSIQVGGDGIATISGGTIKNGILVGKTSAPATLYVTGDANISGYHGINTDGHRNNTITISGSPTIKGTGENGYGIRTMGTLYLSGTPIITGKQAALFFYNTSSDSMPVFYAHDGAGTSTAYSGGDLTVEVGTPSDGKVVINDVTDANKGKFSVTNEGYTLALGTGDNADDLVLAVPVTDHIHTDGITFDTRWSGTMNRTILSANTNIVLTGETTFSRALIIQAGVTVNLCLNGNSLDMGSDTITNNGTLTICDCKEKDQWGTITSASSSILLNNGNLFVTGGTVRAYTPISNRLNATVTIAGGNLRGSDYGIQNYHDTAVAIITGGEVTGRYAAVTGLGKLYLSGSPVIQCDETSDYGDILNNGITIYAYEKDHSENIYTGNPLTVIVSKPAQQVDNVIVYGSTTEKFSLVNTDAQYYLAQIGNDLVLKAYHIHDGITFDTEWSGTMGMITITENTNIVLTGSVDADSISIESGITVNLCLNGHTLDLGTATLYVNGTLNICDCSGVNNGTITGSSSDYCILANGGTVNMTGGTIIGTNFYGIYAWNAAVNISGGVVKSESHHAIWNQQSTTTISGDAGIQGIYNASGGTLIISGGLIRSFSGYAIHNSGETIHLSGGKIISDDSYGIYNDQSSALYLSGTPEFTSAKAAIYNFSSTICAHNEGNTAAYSGDALTVEVSSPSDGKVVINDVTADNKDSFSITNEGWYLEQSGSNLVMRQHHKHEDVTFEKLSITSGELASGNYYLAEDVTATDNITIGASATVTLCLNGHTLNVGNKYITNKYSLTICDCASGGKITGTRAGDNGTIVNQSSSTLTVSSGTIEGEQYAISNEGYGTVTVSGGAVEATGELHFTPIGILNAANGTVSITGGTVSGIQWGIENFGTVTISGGKIEGTACGIENIAGSLYLSGSPVVQSIRPNRPAIIISGGNIYAQSNAATPAAYTGGDLTVQVTNPNDGMVVIHNVTDANKGKFSITNSGWYLVEKGGNLVLSDTEPHTHDGITFDQKFTATSGDLASGNYYLAENVTASDMITIAADAEVTLCLNGKTLDMGSLYIFNQGKLTICDCHTTKDTWGTVTGTHNQNLIMANGSTLIIKAGNYNGAKNPIYSHGGDITIHDAVITGNGGAGIYLNYWQPTSYTNLTVHKGTITGTRGISSINGGDQIHINGGTITGTANTGIYVESSDLSLSGTPVISGAENYAAITLAFNSTRTNAINAEAYTGTADMSVKVTNPADGKTLIAGNVDNFLLTDTDGFTLVPSGSDLVLKKIHSHDSIDFDKELTAMGGELTTGNYCLADSITASGEITIPEGAVVNLCLNGKTLTLGSYRILNKGTLTIWDCQTTQGSILSTGNNAICNNGGKVTVSGGEVKSTASNCSGILNDTSGILEVTGGKITGNSAGIWNSGSTATISGTANVTGSVYGIMNSENDSENPAILKVSGGTVTGSGAEAIYSSGTLRLTGTPTIQTSDASCADLYIGKGDVNYATNYAGGALTIRVDIAACLDKPVLRNVPGTIDVSNTFKLFGSDEDYYLSYEAYDLYLRKVHYHNYTYSVQGNQIKESCDGCDHQKYAIIDAENKYYDGSAYDKATVSCDEGWLGGELTITYTDTDGNPIEAPVNAGDYYAAITKGNAVAKISFSINSIALSAPNNAAWDETVPGKIIWDSVENASGYSLTLYKDDQIVGDPIHVTGTEYTFSITEKGHYKVYIKSTGTGNYHDSAIALTNVTFYSVRWIVDEETVKTDVVMHGQTPVYNGEIPAKVDSTGTYLYTFIGWNADPSPADRDQEYTAQFAQRFAAPAEGEGFTVYYNAEMVRPKSGYEILDGNQWITGNKSIQPGETITIRKAANDDTNASEGTENILPDRPAAPIAPVSSGKTDTSITVTHVPGQEYRISSSPNTWYVPYDEDAECKFDDLAPGTEYEIAARIAATKTAFASELSQPLTISTKSAAGAAPDAPAYTRTETSITITPEDGQEYSFDGGKTWTSTPTPYENLTPGTGYEVWNRFVGTEDAMPSQPRKTTIYTVPAPPVLDDILKLNYKEETITLPDGYKVSTDGQNWQDPEDVPLTPDTTYYVKKSGDQNIPDSTSVPFTSASRSAAPECTVAQETLKNKKDGAFTVPSDGNIYEYSADGGNTWNSVTSSTIDGFSGETILVRIQATEDTPASESSEIKFIPSTATITVNFVTGQGGTEVEAVTGLVYGGKVTKPNDPARDGYTFGGWDWDFDQDTVSENPTTITAQWTLDTPVITVAGKPSTYGTSVTLEARVTVYETSGITYTYQWYTNTTANTVGGTAIPGATNAAYDTPAENAVGDCHYYCEVTAAGDNGQTKTNAAVASVTVKQKDITIEAKNQHILYGEAIDTSADQIESNGLLSGHKVASITLTPSDLDNDQTTEHTITPSGAKILDASGADVTANYSIVYTDGKLTIGPVDPAIVWPSNLSGETNAKLSTVSLTGITNGTNPDQGTFSWKDGNAILTYTPANGEPAKYTMVYTPADTKNYNAVETEIPVTGLDTIAPTGTITITDGGTWDSFWNGLIFSLFYKEAKTVTVTSSDSGSGVAKTEYYLSEKELTLEEAKAVADWTSFTDSFTVDMAANKEEKKVVYVKITDVAGNTAFINSDGLVMDNVVPQIAGLVDGKVYCLNVRFTVSENYLGHVTIDGVTVSPDSNGIYTIGAKTGVQTVTAYDKAGNASVTFSVIVNPRHTFDVWSGWIDGVNTSNCSIPDCDAEMVAIARDTGFATNLEKEAVYRNADMELNTKSAALTHAEEEMVRDALDLNKHQDIYNLEITVHELNETGRTPVSETAQVIEIPIAFSFSLREDISMYRIHEGSLEVLKEISSRSSNAPEGSFYADEAAGVIYVYAQKYSDYGIVFHEHDLIFRPHIEPTEDMNGQRAHWYCRECKKCYLDQNATKEVSWRKLILYYDGNPFTGDYIRIAIAVLVISGIGLAAALFYAKRKKNNKK